MTLTKNTEILRADAAARAAARAADAAARAADAADAASSRLRQRDTLLAIIAAA